MNDTQLDDEHKALLQLVSDLVTEVEDLQGVLKRQGAHLAVVSKQLAAETSLTGALTMAQVKERLGTVPPSPCRTLYT